MKRTINANGFVNRTPKQTTVLLLIIALLIVLFLFRWFYNPYKKVSVIAPKRVKIECCDSILKADRDILDKLVPILKKREGFSDTIYSHLDSYIVYDSDKIHYTIHLIKHWYICYGHLIQPFPLMHQVRFSEHYADSLLRQDILRAYWEVQRINRKSLPENVRSIFITGHEGYKGKVRL